MDVSFDRAVEVPDGVLIREVEGESILLHLESEMYYGLDEIGTHMFRVLASSETIEQAHAMLVDEYDVGSDRLRQDLHDLVQALVDNGLLVLQRGSPPPDGVSGETPA